MLRPRTPLFNKTTDTPSGGGESKPVDVAAAIAAIEDKTLPMTQRFGVALNALKGIDPTNQLADVKKQLTDAQAAATLKDGEIAKLKTDLDAAQSQLTARNKDVTELEASNAQLEKEMATLKSKEQDIDSRAESKSKEKLAALGFPAAQLPKTTDASKAGATNYDEAMAHYATLTDPKARANYYAAAIMPILAGQTAAGGAHGRN